MDINSHDFSPQLNTIEGFNFDTRNTISAYAELVTINPVMQRCSYYNNLLSKTVPDSDVWKINHAGGAPVQVSVHTLRILQTAASVRARLILRLGRPSHYSALRISSRGCQIHRRWPMQ